MPQLSEIDTKKRVLSILFFFTAAVIIKAQPDGIFEMNRVMWGYSHIIFNDTNPQDANAAIFMWTDEIRKNVYLDFKKKIDLFPYIFYSTDEMVKSLNENKVDIVALSIVDYFTLKEKFSLVPSLAGVINTSPYTHYVLIVKKDSGINSLKDLRGKILSQPKNEFNPLINIWISSLLEKRFGMDRDAFFKQVKIEEKNPNAVYSVFFEKSDCAIVQQDLFSTLSILNPQVSGSIKILESSPGVITFLTAYKKKSESKVKDLLTWLANNVHKSHEGQNILKIFKVNRLAEITDKDLVSTKILIDEYKNGVSKREKMKRRK